MRETDRQRRRLIFYAIVDVTGGPKLASPHPKINLSA